MRRTNRKRTIAGFFLASTVFLPGCNVDPQMIMQIVQMCLPIAQQIVGMIAANQNNQNNQNPNQTVLGQGNGNQLPGSNTPGATTASTTPGTTPGTNTTGAANAATAAANPVPGSATGTPTKPPASTATPPASTAPAAPTTPSSSSGGPVVVAYAPDSPEAFTAVGDSGAPGSGMPNGS